jgi:hypothetical protein
MSWAPDMLHFQQLRCSRTLELDYAFGALARTSRPDGCGSAAHAAVVGAPARGDASAATERTALRQYNGQEMGVHMRQDLVCAAEEAPIVLTRHMRVESGLRLPILVKNPHSRIGIGPVQVVIDAAWLGERGRNQRQHAPSKLILLARFRPGDGNGCHHARWRRGAGLRNRLAIAWEPGPACHTGREKAEQAAAGSTIRRIFHEQSLVSLSACLVDE